MRRYTIPYTEVLPLSGSGILMTSGGIDNHGNGGNQTGARAPERILF